MTDISEIVGTVPAWVGNLDGPPTQDHIHVTADDQGVYLTFRLAARDGAAFTAEGAALLADLLAAHADRVIAETLGSQYRLGSA